MQECTYPVERFAEALEGCALAVITTINYTRPLLACAARAGVPVATDVQAIAEIDDAYNADYLRAACIVFMSGERLPVGPEEWAREILGRYGPEILVIGLGAAGALLAVRRDGRLERVPAVRTRPIVSTVGAGDALFAAFVHGYTATRDPYGALRKAIVFASYKIGAVGGAEGFLSAEQLDALATQVRLGS